MVCAYVEQKKGKYSALAGVCMHTYSSLVYVWTYEIECRLKSIRDLLFCKTIRIVTWVFANQNTLHGIPDTVPCWSQPCNIVANSNTNRVKDTPQSNTHAKFNFIQRTSTKKVHLNPTEKNSKGKKNNRTCNSSRLKTFVYAIGLQTRKLFSFSSRLAHLLKTANAL